jgi:hypothetical protein
MHFVFQNHILRLLALSPHPHTDIFISVCEKDQKADCESHCLLECDTVHIRFSSDNQNTASLDKRQSSQKTVSSSDPKSEQYIYLEINS